MMKVFVLIMILLTFNANASVILSCKTDGLYEIVIEEKTVGAETLMVAVIKGENSELMSYNLLPVQTDKFGNPVYSDVTLPVYGINFGVYLVVYNKEFASISFVTDDGEVPLYNVECKLND